MNNLNTGILSLRGRLYNLYGSSYYSDQRYAMQTTLKLIIKWSLYEE